MGMYPVQNYGEDFNKSMIGMGNFINGMQNSVHAEEQRNIDNARANKTLEIQKDTRDAAIRHETAQTNKILREERDAKLLQDFTEVTPEFDPANRLRPKSEKALQILADVNARTSYTPNDLKNIEQHDKALNAMQGAINMVVDAPPSDKPFVVKRSDNIAVINDIMDANDFLRTNDLKKESHVNAGQIAELPKGAKYSVNTTDAYTFVSGKGTGAVTPWYSIVDDNGNPVMKSDGTPVLVPRTADRSNNPESRLDAVPIEALQGQVLFGKAVTDALKTLSPEEAKYVQERIHAKRIALGDKTAIRDDKPMVLADGGMLVRNDGTIIAENAKTQPSEYKSRNRQEGTKEVFEESQDGGRTWKKVSDGPKFNPRPDNNGNAELFRNKKDISIRLRDAQRGYQTALKTGDPDAINESINTIESLNDSAKEYGVKPQPVPNRMYTTAENDIIKAQAVKNLEEQRGRASKVFGIKPSMPAISQEMRRLKQTVKPGSVSFEEPQTQAQPQQQPQGQTRPQGQPQARTATFDAPPPAAQHNGRLIQDHSTGKKYRSIKGQWVEER